MNGMPCLWFTSQGVTDTPVQSANNADAVSSSLLDNLDITDAEKKEVGRAMQT
jgi:hypothetical protein